MKHLSKTIIATLVSASFAFTAPSVLASQEEKTEKLNTETTNSAEAQSNKNSDVNKAPQQRSDEKTLAEATPSEIAKEVELKEHNHDFDEDSDSWHFHCHDEDCDDESFDFEYSDISDNTRDGFYLNMSGISSTGDDFSLFGDENSSSEFDLDFSYRVQFLGFFMESPGLSSRRTHGMYSISAWGYNFYNSDDWAFDLYYQNSTRGIDGLKEIQIRNQKKRGGVRATGYFDNSLLQIMFSPISGNSEGSDGIEASISYGVNWQLRNWNFYTNLGVQYRSKEVLPHGETIVPDDDLSTSAGITTSAEIGVEYPLSTDWVIGGFAGYTSLSDRTIASRDDDVEDGYRAGLLLTYVF
ncbi:MAG: MipA/OmpV family protein [Colwellia sp.]|nr:MipA/OmpV family protein [Colwellia sp.]